MENPEIISNKSEVNAISFNLNNGGLKYTNGQLKLLQLFNNKILSKEPVTKDEIISVYFDYGAQWNRIYLHSDFGIPEWVERKIWNEKGVSIHYKEYIKWRGYCPYMIMRPTIMWFKNNIGALVLKGALVAIPVLQIGDDALKCLDNKK